MNDAQLRRPYRPLNPAVPREQPRGFLAAIWGLRIRLVLAAVSGLVAFLFGIALQTVFIRLAGLAHFPAYVLQNLFSTQLSFFLARHVTWGDRRVRLLPSLGRYNVQQLSTMLLSFILFAGLDWIGMNYIAASFIVTLAIAPLSFFVAHKWSIAERQGPAEVNRASWAQLADSANP